MPVGQLFCVLGNNCINKKTNACEWVCVGFTYSYKPKDYVVLKCV